MEGCPVAFIKGVYGMKENRCAIRCADPVCRASGQCQRRLFRHGLGFGAVRDQLAHIGHVQPYATHPARQRGGEWSENSHARVVVAFPCVASAIRVPRQRPVPEDVLSP